MTRFVVITILLLFLSSCIIPIRSDSEIVSYKWRQDIPNSRVYETSFIKYEESKVPVFISRDNCYTASIWSAGVKIDDLHIVDIRAGEGVLIYVNPGKHSFKTTIPLSKTAIEADLIQGLKYTYRIGFGEASQSRFSGTISIGID